MRKLSAHYIFPANRPPLKYGIIKLDDEGKILEVIDSGGKLKEEANLEFYPGALMPGFVNSHCHLELSHMLNIIPQKAGLTNFIRHINEKRSGEDLDIEKKIILYSSKMYRSGISVVADIVNTDNTIMVKTESPIHWHSFVELFGINPADADNIWQSGVELEKRYQEAGLSASISPHAPYSLSKDLWKHFKSYTQELISIHNQESKEEEELMVGRKGEMFNFFKTRGILEDNLPHGKKTSLESIISHLPDSKRILLVHNTVSSKYDIKIALERFGPKNVYWILCPNANLYIENSLPESIIENREDLQLCLGTDSLASNTQLSILEEMKTLQEHFPYLKLADLIKWGSLNGAKALGIENTYGSFERGKKPGVVWIKNLNFPELKLTKNSVSARIV